MPYYCVNKNAQSEGYHEVHETSPNECSHLPNEETRRSLGWHENCIGAIRKAKREHCPKVDGCFYCCKECHSR